MVTVSKKWNIIQWRCITMKKKVFIFLFIFLIIIIGIGVIIFNKPSRQNIDIPILLYHDFVLQVPNSDPDNFNYINTPESFEENIKTLLENGYTFLSFKELNDALHNKKKLPKKPILITLDDGYYSNYKYIFPILKKYSVKASIFIVTDNIGKTVNGKKYLTWQQCKSMQDSDLVEIFSHSTRHVFYDKLSVSELRNDVKKSYKEIEKYLGKQELKVFAYPYGAYTKESVLVLKLNGIDMQVYDIGINNFKTFNKSYIKRINIPCEMTGKEIIQEMNSINY